MVRELSSLLRCVHAYLVKHKNLVEKEKQEAPRDLILGYLRRATAALTNEPSGRSRATLCHPAVGQPELAARKGDLSKALGSGTDACSKSRGCGEKGNRFRNVVPRKPGREICSLGDITKGKDCVFEVAKGRKDLHTS